ncbi:MAG: glycosyltransferase family 39 protein [Planctomycetaceae bacterium]|nr:glycosyltransferase family 39 protein [Planctomycetaceae bacterium]
MHGPLARLRITVAALALLAAVHVGLVVHEAWVKSPTLDEVAHLAAGLSHVEFGTFDLYRVNPPLARLPAGIALKLVGVRMEWSDYTIAAVDRNEFAAGRVLAELNADRYRELAFVARLACLPWTLLGMGLCYVWGCDLYGAAGGLFAAALWAFCPETIAHGSMVTPDVAGAALGLLAGYAFHRWLRDPGWGRALTAGISLGFALLAKFTWVILPVLWPALALAWFWHERSTFRAAALRIAQLATMSLTGLVVLHAGYGYEDGFRPLGEFDFRSEALGGESARGYGRTGNRFRGTAFENLPVPLPRNVLEGIDVQKDDFERGLPSYLTGHWQDHGWWHYYLYATVVKLPIGLWVLGALAVFRGRFRRDEWIVAAPAVAVFCLVSSQTGFNHHFRYVLPALPFAFVLIGRLAGGPVAVLQRRTRWIVAAAFGWMAAASLWIHPHHLSYFNELAGGPRNGHIHLVDSNIDWGQDLWLLQDWLDEHRDGRPLGLVYFGGFIQPAWFGIDHELPPRLVRREGRPPQGEGPKPGLYAVSVNFLRGRTQFSVPDGHGGEVYVRKPYWTYFLAHFEPVATAGHSIYIYDLSPEEVDGVRERLGLQPLSE